MKIPNSINLQATIGNNDGETFVSIYYAESECGRDYYEDGTEYDWQDNNGLKANCHPKVLEMASAMALDILQKNS
jgi:hypothetical protein